MRTNFIEKGERVWLRSTKGLQWSWLVGHFADVGRVAAQANGTAFMHYGDTVVLSTATASEKPREGN